MPIKPSDVAVTGFPRRAAPGQVHLGTPAAPMHAAAAAPGAVPRAPGCGGRLPWRTAKKGLSLTGVDMVSLSQ